jgi:hypothetical protein
MSRLGFRNSDQADSLDVTVFSDPDDVATSHKSPSQKMKFRSGDAEGLYRASETE